MLLLVDVDDDVAVIVEAATDFALFLFPPQMKRGCNTIL